MTIELSNEIKQKLSEAVELWADENLYDKPGLLANCMYLSLEQTMIEQIKKIKEVFK